MKALEVFSPEELIALQRRIERSGELGRSKNYSALLDYLIRNSNEGKAPKEIEIAIDVLRRGEDFDVAADSTVRVYIHQLRKKLDNYYEKYELDASHRIVIPKGQYTVSAELLGRTPQVTANPEVRIADRRGLNTVLLCAAIFLLLANLGYLVGEGSSDPESEAFRVAQSSIWQGLFDDDMPITLVMGDYYIFGELNSNGNIARMVREFNVNSRADLEDLQFTEYQRAQGYLDLDISYMPEGSAYALTRIVPVIERGGKTPSIMMMSDLSTADIRSSHIVYIGYISALEKLTEMAFAGSGLAIGRSYDELVQLDTVEYYTSDAGLPEEGQAFRDYGLFSTFPASDTTQVIVVSGMRDAGLMHTAQALASVDSLQELANSVSSSDLTASRSFEALYEVFGVDRMNFNSKLIYSNQMDEDLIWRDTLTSID